MTIDIHTHLGPRRMEYEGVNSENLTQHVDTLIGQMDAFGVEKALLTPLEPYISTDLYLRASTIYPDRLMCAGSVIPRPIDRARQRISEFVKKGCKAIVLDERTFHPQDPAAISMVQEAVDKNLAVYLHNHEMAAEMITFIDTISRVYPEGRFVVLHMGGLFGFHNLVPLMGRHNIWLDVSTTLIKLVESPLRVFLDALVQDIGVRRLVFGSDHYTDYSDLFAALNMMDLNVETSNIIRIENAEKILDL